jgi:uncharacterized protein (DUF924 family)
MTTPEAVLGFWLDELEPGQWYAVDAAVDAEIRRRFGAAWEAARGGAFGPWMASPEGALALLILTDQFPRNMFRGEARAFATDRLALARAKQAIGLDHDHRIEPPARQFFYLPLMHSESLTDQDRCVRLMLLEMPPSAEQLLHARAHREVIRRFGRFPYRNAALGRANTPEEAAYLADGAYGSTVKALKAAG